MTEPSLAVVIERLDNLKEQNERDHAEMKTRVQEGFEGVHKRQDFANGRTGTLEKNQLLIDMRLKEVEGQVSEVQMTKKERKKVWYENWVSVLAGLIGGAVVWVLSHLKI